MNPQSVSQKLKDLKAPSYRLKQAFRAYFQDLLPSWQDISTWPLDMRSAFDEKDWSPLTLENIVESENPSSAKFLFKTEDGSKIESVILRFDNGRNTVCLSSQAGCGMGCTFCATGKLGFTRNLTTEEIVDQVVQCARWLKTRDIRHAKHDTSDVSRLTNHESQATGNESRVTNIVFMGMGEPFNNPDNVFKALDWLNDPDMFALGARHMSISTCGIIPGIERLADEQPQVNLAISLHAPNQTLREKLMPVSRAYPLERLMRALRKYMDITNRKVMFEYLMIDGLNDSDELADELADLLSQHKHLSHVNLIKYHDTGVYEASPQPRIKHFANILKRRGIAVTIRTSFGEDINAACGQLAAKN